MYSKLYNKWLEKQLTKEREVQLPEEADILYPPPSAYEVAQINKELGKNYHALSGQYRRIKNGN